MASNPIKRRARQSFFLGFLIALVIMAIVVMLLFTKINALNEENEKLKVLGPKVSVYTVSKDIEEGEPITIEDLEATTMQLTANSTGIDVASYVDPQLFYKTNEETGEEEEVTYTARVKIPAGSVAVQSMLQDGDAASDERLMEYGMIVLPSQLKNGDYIDIRLRLADGTEYIVLSKKKIEQCTETAIWMKMKEIEILTMNSAIVDAYLVKGSQLRATVYTNPMMQEATETTYAVNNEVLTNITYNKNILSDAITGLLNKWKNTTNPSGGGTDYVIERRTIDSYVEATQEEKADTVDSKYSEEASNISTARSEYVSALEGTGLVGTTAAE